jgi:hypothetical protein
MIPGDICLKSGFHSLEADSKIPNKHECNVKVVVEQRPHGHSAVREPLFHESFSIRGCHDDRLRLEFIIHERRLSGHSVAFLAYESPRSH